MSVSQMMVSSTTFVLAVVLTAFIGVPAFAGGQALGLKRPVLDHRIDPEKVEQYEAAVVTAMAMSEEELLSFVPEKTPTYFCHCPNCHGGSQGLGVMGWDVANPQQLTCNYCGMVFPNDQYPADQMIEGENVLGEIVQYSYHQDRKYDDLRIFYEGYILEKKRTWIQARAYDLAKAYAVTGKPEYARRVALILDRIAQVYPHYPVMKQWIRLFEFAPSQEPPYPSNGGRWDRWTSGELPEEPALCYDLIYNSDEFDKLSAERGYDVRERLEQEFFIAIFDANNTPPLEESGQLATRNLRRAGIIGQVINEPRIVHWSFNWLKTMAHQRCFYDGSLSMAPSYHYQIMGDFRTSFNLMRGYTDPLGYVHPETEVRFDNLQPEEVLPFILRAYRAPSIVDFPNGTSSPFHDTWAGERRSDPRDTTVSTILPGFGHASLGRGQGSNQMQAQLHFSGAYKHSHRDNLNLTLWAKEREMLCDIGYSHVRSRLWAANTMGHNLVAVDREEQVGSGDPSAGDLVWFFPDSGGVSVTEADSTRVYANIGNVDRYRRMLIMVPVSDADAYVLDVFRVRGGKTHDWLLHGDADRDMNASCSVELPHQRPDMLEDDEEWVEPVDESSRFNLYGCIRDVAYGAVQGTVTITFAYVDEPSRGLRTHITAGDNAVVNLGVSPSIRRAGKFDSEAFDYWMPQLLVRRTGQAPLQSTFGAVYEPFAGDTFITEVSAISVEPGDDGVYAVRVEHGNAVDTIISTLDQAPYPERQIDGVSLHGRLGIVRREGGTVIGMWLFEGESLACAGQTLAGDTAAFTGTIQAAIRSVDGALYDALITDADLPEGDQLKDVWMVVTHGNGYTHGYLIERVERHEGLSHIVLSMDHGLRIDGEMTEELYFPQRQIAGVNAFAIPLQTSR
ncbi:MAG: hypothetical protein GX358_11450 [candidate division WS1 bacterium]|nr:hypothetical protein [candidate division WS1 bacterium]